MDNRSHDDTDWDLDLLGPELEELHGLDFDLGLTGFEQHEIDKFLADPEAEDRANAAPPLPETPVTRPGDLWLCAKHRILCGDATSAHTVARLLAGTEPLLLVTDPPYGVSLDGTWRDKAGINKHGPAEPSYMKHRTEGHTHTTISGDTIADWSHAFELVPSLAGWLRVAREPVHSEVLAGLLRIGFVHHQQIIWRKTQAALTRTHYWFQHEPCLVCAKEERPLVRQAGRQHHDLGRCLAQNDHGWLDEEKFDHPTQKPVELMRRPILNHTRRGELVYDPFLGSGTTLMAAELTERVCYGMELDPKYVDVIVQRWHGLHRQASHARGGRPDIRAGQSRKDGGSQHESNVAAGRLRPSNRN